MEWRENNQIMIEIKTVVEIRKWFWTKQESTEIKSTTRMWSMEILQFIENSFIKRNDFTSKHSEPLRTLNAKQDWKLRYKFHNSQPVVVALTNKKETNVRQQSKEEGKNIFTHKFFSLIKSFEPSKVARNLSESVWGPFLM